MSPPAKPCGKCKHYLRKHTGGPKGYGTCASCGLPVHANESGCEKWEVVK